MITNKQKAKDLIKVAESVMNLDRAIKEMRETTRLLVKELKAIDEPIIKGEDDDIISFSQKVDDWYDKTYKSIFSNSKDKIALDVRYLTMDLKYLNQIKEDIDRLYKGNTVFDIKAKKLKLSSKTGFYEYTLRHNLYTKYIGYDIFDDEGDRLVDLGHIIDKNSILVANDEQCNLKIVFHRNKFSGVDSFTRIKL